MRASASLSLVLLVLFASVASAAKRDRDRDRDDLTPPPVPQKNPEADRNRAEAEQAYQKGDFRRVVEIANLLLATYPTDNPHVAYYWRASAQVELGRQARSARQVRDGIADARQGIASEGKRFAWLYIPYLYGLSSLTELENRSDHAALAVQVATPVLQRPVGADFTADDKAQIYFQRAVAQAARKDLAAATLDYTEAIRLNPQHVAAQINRAEALAAQHRTRDAIAAYDEAVKLFPNLLVAHNNRGNLRQSTGDLDGAIVDFTRALQIDPKFGVGYINRGHCLARQNSPQAAEGDFTEALRQTMDAPMQGVAYRFRAVARLSQGNVEGALADYAAALKLNPKDATLYEERGCARFFAKDFSGAAGDFAKAIEMNPQLVRLVPWQATALARNGKTAEARAALDAARNAKSAPPAWIAKLDAYLADQITEQDLLTAAAELTPETEKSQRLCEARFFIGQKKLLANEPDPAAEQFREAIATKSFAATAFRGARFELNDFTN
jgi:tetratricopeptide (TPR) repeat protein